MKRRQFMQSVGALAAAGAIPATAAPREEVRQYGWVARRRWAADPLMPQDVLRELNERARHGLATVNGREVSREYLWLPFDKERYEKGDALAVHGVGAIKIRIAMRRG